MPLVEIPEVGTVEFPESMSRDDIASTIKNKIIPRQRFQAFVSSPDVTTTETSPLLPTRHQNVPGNLEAPNVPTEAQQIEQQVPTTDVPLKIGEAPATIPRFGEPKTVTRGISDVISGLGEFVLNKPEEVALSLYPPTAAAIALRYGPEMGKQWLEDIYRGIKGDKEATGRAVAMLAAVGGPLGVKKGVEAVKSAGLDAEFQSQYAGMVDQLARENLRISDQPALVTPGPEPTVLEQVAPKTAEAVKETPKVLTPALTEEDVSRLFIEPEAKRTEAELAQAPKEEAQAPVAPQVEPQAVGAPAQPMTPVRQIALGELARQGWNPKWPFVQADLLNKSFRDAIRADPILSSEEKAKILSFGPKDEPTPTPKVEPATTPAPALTEGGASEAGKTAGPTQAAEKVQAEVKAVAKTEGARSAKEIKSELVDRLEKAHESAPTINDFTLEQQAKLTKAQSPDFGEVGNFRYGKRGDEQRAKAIEAVKAKRIAEATAAGFKQITIEIPGDGTFTIWNTKESIGDVLESARRLKTGKEPPSKAGPGRLDAAEYLKRDVKDALRVYGDDANAYQKLTSQLDRADELGIEEAQKNRLQKLTKELEKRILAPWENARSLLQSYERNVDANQGKAPRTLEQLKKVKELQDSVDAALYRVEQQLGRKPWEPRKSTTPPSAEPSVGPGAASPETEFSNPTIDELIQPHLRPSLTSTPEARAAEAPPAQTFLGRVRGYFMSGSAHNTVDAIKGWVGTIAGKTLPKTTLKDRLSGELGARFIASRAAAAPMADVFVNDVLAGLKVDQAKFDAALKADNLLSIKDAFQAEADKLHADPAKTGEAEAMQAYADGVNTLIGSAKFPFKTEQELVDYFKDPQVAEAVRRHIDNWKAAIEPLYRTTQNIDPTVELPTRGKYSGARVNLNPIVKGQYEPTNGPIIGSSGNLLGTLRRRNPFAQRAMGTGQNYVLNYSESIANSFSKQLEIANKKAFEDRLVDTGNAVIDNIGKHPTLADGAATKAYPLMRRGFQNKSIYIRDTLSKEYEIAANVVLNPYRGSLVVEANRVFAQAALAGLTDATVHIENLGTALFQVPGATGTPLLVDSLLSAVGRMDIPVIAARLGLKSVAEVGRTRLMKYLPQAIQDSVNKALLKNMTQMAALAEINATRVPHGSRLPGSKQLGMAVLNADKSTRMVLDDTFRNLLKQGLVKGTETNRREFINQAGNYNLRAQGPWMRFLRQTYIAPFATAGRNFATLGVRGITLNPGVEASSIKAAAALRANMLSKWVGTAALVATVNYLITGKLMGRAGTPLGAIDTGKNDANGRAKYFNVAAFTGQSRALRTVGARGAIEASRLGLKPSDQSQAAVRDITNVGLQSIAGPGARAAMIAATGFPPAVNVGRASAVAPPGERQWVANVKEAAWEANPILASIHEATKPGGTWQKAIERQLPRFTLTTGKPQAMVENYPKVVSMAQSNEFMEDVIHQARQLPRVDRYKFVQEQVNRLEPALRQHARQEALRRKVYSRP